MVTVPPSELVKNIPADRMPAILDDEDWPTWLGENEATADQVKSVLKTIENVRWTAAPEAKRAKPARATGPSKVDSGPSLL